jgi:hypothetical protein
VVIQNPINILPNCKLTNQEPARAEVSLAPLALDPYLVACAQEYANELASLDIGLKRSKTERLRQLSQGENLVEAAGRWDHLFTAASENWFAQKKNWPGGEIPAERPFVDHPLSDYYLYTQVSDHFVVKEGSC